LRKKNRVSKFTLKVLDKIIGLFKEENAADKKEKRDIQLYHKVSKLY